MRMMTKVMGSIAGVVVAAPLMVGCEEDTAPDPGPLHAGDAGPRDEDGGELWCNIWGTVCEVDAAAPEVDAGAPSPMDAGPPAPAPTDAGEPDADCCEIWGACMDSAAD